MSIHRVILEEAVKIADNHGYTQGLRCLPVGEELPQRVVASGSADCCRSPFPHKYPANTSGTTPRSPTLVAANPPPYRQADAGITSIT